MTRILTSMGLERTPTGNSTWCSREGEAADLDFAGGATEDAIKAWVRLSRNMTMDYAAYVDG